MHYGFNLALDRKDLPISDSVVDRHNNAVNEKVVNLRNYLMEDESSISAELIAEHLFPEVPCDVFISHSYSDQDMAIQLAYELKQKGVIAFVDSVFWGSAYALLRTIDKNYSRIEGSPNFYLDRCNRSAAHVYMILVGALQRMIMQSSTLLFLNTDRSVSSKQSIQGEAMTHSPWIHMELTFSHLIWTLHQGRYISHAGMESFGSDVPIFHTAPVEHLKVATSFEFMSWLKACPDRDDNQYFNAAVLEFHEQLERAS